ncbi:hypothetical protein KCU67_g1626, partial [Aureobasidium melanogenum]
MSIASPRPSLNLPSSRRGSTSTINSTRSPSTSRPASIRDNHTANSTPVPASTRRRDRAALREFYNLQATESNPKSPPTAPTSQPEDSGPQDALSALDDPSFSAKAYADELLNTSDAATLLRTLNSITISALGLEGDKKALVYDNYTTLLSATTSGVQPPEFFNYTSEANCDLWTLIDNALFAVNPYFDVYEITQMCPVLWDVLGTPTQLIYTPAGADVYFDRTDVKQGIHAPLNVSWAECSTNPVFVGGNTGPESEGDVSADPIQHVLPRVIEATNRVLIANGDFDMIVITNGTLMSIQNMTWNGKLGFGTQPSTPINITIPDLVYANAFDSNDGAGLDGPQGTMGIQLVSPFDVATGEN